ncbi:MAG: isoaspartyl peptidase/L-asparaginase, partial [Bacteroidota bacterium]
MKYWILVFGLVTIAVSTSRAQEGPVAIAIHGGAGTILPENMTLDVEAQYRETLERALQAGHAILTAGGPSVDAVVAAVQVMEESTLFNAGRGAVFTAEGTVELDASI